MSTTIDERVVEMRFDNRQFENNVQTSMSTLDKLKQKLNFNGASKGLENINTAAKNVNMTALGTAVETVKTKFSALEVMGVTALANITNQAVNAGKRMVSALTIDPIKTGFSEYETKINAIQVIQANTRGKNTMEDITAALEELNTYADKTIYNFAQMTSNIGKFTAQGLDVKQAANAVQGLANLAAASGASAEDMSRATYQMSQSLSSTIKLIDWNSLRNANMATTTLKETLIDLAKVNGIAIDDMIAKHGSFEQTLSEGWLSGEMFTEAMNIYSGVYSEAELKAKGFNDQQVKNFLDLAKMAESAATEVKTFTQLWDVLKETAQSGWTQTWELIIGDFDSAKSMLTNVQNYLSDIINGWSEARNKLLESAFAKGFKDLAEKINSLIKPATEAVDTVKETVEAVTDLGKVVDEVIFGKFGNGQERFDALTKAGINYYEVQNKVNETLGDSFRYSQEQIDAQKKVLGTQDKVTESTEEAAEVTKEITDADAERIEMLSKLSDAQLKEMGYTQEQIDAFKELRDVSEKLGIPIRDLVKNIDEINGRWLFIESFKNIGQGLVKTFEAIGKAFTDIFPPMTAEQLFDIIAGFHKLTTKLKPTGQTLDKIRRIFRGVFAAIDVVAKITGGALKIAFEVVKGLLDYFKVDILDLAANVGDAIVKFNDWIDSLVDVQAVVEVIGPVIQTVVQALADLVKLIGESEGFQGFLEMLKSIGSSFGEWFKGLKETDDIPKYIFEGLVNGIIEWTPKVVKALFDLGKAIIESICEVLGINSPSTVFMAIGGFIMAGLAIGIRDGWGEVWNVITDIFSNIVTFIQNLDMGTLIAGAVAVGITGSIWKISSALEALASPFDGLGDFLEELGDGAKAMLKGMGKMFKGVGSWLKASAWQKRANAILTFAIAIGVLAAAVWALAQLDQGAMWSAIGAIGALAVIVGGLAFAMSKISNLSGLQLGKISATIITLSLSILILAGAMKILASMDGEALGIGYAVIVGLAGIVAGLMIVSSKWGYGAKNLGGTLIGISIAMLMMVGIMKLVGMMDLGEIIGGLAVIAVLGGIIVGLIAATQLAGKDKGKIATTLLGISLAMLMLVGIIKIVGNMRVDELVIGLGGVVVLGLLIAAFVKTIGKYTPSDIAKVGTTVLAISTAMLLLVGVMKIIGNMGTEELIKGFGGVVVLGVLIAAFIKVLGEYAPSELAKIGTTILAISVAMLLLAGVAKIIETMSWEGMLKAGIGLGAFVGIIALLVTIVKKAGPDVANIGVTLLLLSGSIALLAGVALVLSLISWEGLAKGVGAVAILGLIMMGLIAVCKNAQNCKDELIVLTIAVAVLAGAVALLSFIKPEQLLPASLALGLIMGMFGIMIACANGVKASMSTLIVMTVAVGVLAGMLYLIGTLPVQASLSAAAALSMLLLSMSISFALISSMSGNALIASGVLIVMTGIVAILAIILWSLRDLQPEQALGTVIVLSVLMLAMSAVCALVSLIPAGAAIQGAIGLAGFIGIMAVVLGVLGGLMQIPGVDKVLADGGKALGLIGFAIGNFVGSIIGGVGAGLSSGLPAIGQNLSEFMTNVTPFIEGIKMVDSNMMDKVGALAGAILALTGADLLANIASFIGGGSSFAQLGADLSAFMINATPFIAGAMMLNPEMMTGVKALADTIITLTSANILDSLTSWFTGGASLADFGAELAAFGPYVAQFAESVASVNAETVVASANAAKALAEMATALPNSGGLVSWFTGENDMSVFGTQLVAFGKSLNDYSLSVAGINSEAITVSVTAAKSLAEMADAIPNYGGLLSWFTGENDMATFGAQLVIFGGNLKTYSQSVVGINEEAINVSVTAAKSLSEMADAIPNFGGMVSWFTGDNDLVTFGAQLVSFGESIKSYSESVVGIDTEAITASVTATQKLSELSSTLDNSGGMVSWFTGDNDLGTFGDNLKKFGSSLKSYSDEISGISTAKMSSATTQFYRLSNLAKDIQDTDFGGLSNFGEALRDIGVAGIDGFISAFEDGYDKASTAARDLADKIIETLKNKHDTFVEQGTKIIDKLASGIKKAKSTAKSAFADLLTTMVASIKNKYENFYNAGSYLVTGFAAGISDNDYKAEAKARAMAKAAKEAAEDELGIESPSKEFYKVGAFAGMGFVNALGDYGQKAYVASADMASSARTGLGDAIATVRNLIEGDWDVQPTIRPVLDLSDVRAGAGSIGNLLNIGSSVGVLANVGVISSTMNRNGQNGKNGEVVGAINKLRKDLGNVGNNTYNINGVTYDDGSNVSDAVKVLVRAAKVERRR